MSILSRNKVLYYALLVATLILLSLSLSFAPLITFGITVAIVMFVLLYLYTIQIFNFTLVLLLAIPANVRSYDFFHLNIPIINLDIFKAVLFEIALVILIKKLIKKELFELRNNWFAIILFISFFVYYLLGIHFHNGAVYTDAKNFFFIPLLYMIGVSLYTKKKMFKPFFRLVVISSFLLSIFSITIFVFKHSIFQYIFDGSFDADTSRVGFANHSNFSFTIPLMILAIKTKVLGKKMNSFIFITLVLMLITLILGQSRALIFAVIVNTIVILVYTSYFTDKKAVVNNIINLMVFISFTLLIILAAFLVFPSISNQFQEVFQRFYSVYKDGGTVSLNTRKITNNYYEQLISKNLLGYGMGKDMWLINDFGHPFVQGMNIDNAFITITYKFGIIGLILWLVFYVINITRVYRYRLFRKGTVEGFFATCFLLCMPLSFLNSTFFTAQLAMNSSVYAFTVMMLILFHNNNLNKSKLMD
ncbi:O-antigen ligase family protein [Heyndrickxia coagulans]|uniref:O-antigen ligase family protein n=1 Tax=Heyndrickxia coagulans TaxID=1398 RepID=UPI00031F1AB6|nr:O-antigen ligase family protein [Heyndrickxia coagulans]